MKRVKAEELKVGDWIKIGESFSSGLARREFGQISYIGKLGEPRQKGEAKIDKSADRVPAKIKGDRYNYYLFNEPALITGEIGWLVVTEEEIALLQLQQ